MIPASRSEAKEKGYDFYFTGNPCKHGHISKRYASYGGCVECAYEHAMSYRKRNPEWWDSYMKKWRSENPGKPKEYYWNNPYVFRKRASENYWNNLYYKRESNSTYKKMNPEANRAREAKRRSRLKGSFGNFGKDDVIRLLSLQKRKCASCGNSLSNGYHIDHIMPIALGGENDKHNIQLLCPSCNCSKHAKHPIDWAQENGRLL